MNLSHCYDLVLVDHHQNCIHHHYYLLSSITIIVTIIFPLSPCEVGVLVVLVNIHYPSSSLLLSSLLSSHFHLVRLGSLSTCTIHYHHYHHYPHLVRLGSLLILSIFIIHHHRHYHHYQHYHHYPHLVRLGSLLILSLNLPLSLLSMFEHAF